MKRLQKIYTQLAFLLLAIIAQTGTAQSPYPVYWKDFNCLVQSGDTLLNPTGNGWAGSAVSINKLSGNGWMEYTIDPSPYSNKMIGLLDKNINFAGNNQYQDIDYILYQQGNTIARYPGGNSVTVSTGDIVRLERSGTKIYYKKNGTAFDSTANCLSGELFIKASIGGHNEAFKNVRCSFEAAYTSLMNFNNINTSLTNPDDGNTGAIDLSVSSGYNPYTYIWMPDGETTQDISGKAPGSYTVTISDQKTSVTREIGIGYKIFWKDFNSLAQTADTLINPTYNSWESNAVSINKLTGNAWMEYTIDETNNSNKMIGLLDRNINFAGDNQYQDIDYCLYHYGNSVSRYPGGSSVTVNIGDIVRIERSGTKIYYKKNGMAFDSTLNCLSGELFIKASIGGHNEAFKNVRCSFAAPYSSLMNFYNINSNYTNSPDENAGAIDLSVSNGYSPYTYNWQPGNETTQDISGKAPGTYTLTITDQKTSVTRVIGIGYKCFWKDFNSLTQTADTLINTTYQGWASSAVTHNKLTGNGWIEYTIDEIIISNKMIGLLDQNTNFSGNNQYQDIDYNLYQHGNLLYHYSGGSFVTVNTGDVVRVERSGTKIYYKKNGVAFDSTLNCLSGELFVKASIGGHNEAFKNVRCSFAAPPITSLGFIAHVRSINSIPNDADGRIDLSVNGGQTPYTYHWEPYNSNEPYITDKDPHTYTLTVSDQIGGTKTQVIGLGYGVYWKDFNCLVQTGDTLLNPTYNGWNSSAVSINKLTGNGWMEYTIDQTTNSNKMIGLLDNNTLFAGNNQYQDIDYILYQQGNSIARYPGGNSVTVAFGDIVRLERNGTKIYYKKNGVAFDSTLNCLSGELFIKASIGGHNEAFKNVRCSFEASYTSLMSFNNVNSNYSLSADENAGAIDLSVNSGYSPYTYQWLPGGETTQDISGKAPGTYTVTITDQKTSVTREIGIGYKIFWKDFNSLVQTADTLINPTSNSWESNAVSINKLTGNGWMEYTIDETNNSNKMIGLLDKNINFAGDNQYQDIDYNLYHYGNSVSRYPGGSSVTVNIGDVVRLERSGTKIYYKKNGIAFDSTLNCLSGELFVKASIGGHNETFKNVRCSFAAPYNSLMNTFTLVTNLTTNEDGNAGAIDLSVSNGYSPYTYNWQSGNETTQDISSKATGTYTVTISDQKTSIVREVGIGYKLFWKDFSSLTQTGDTLINNSYNDWASSAVSYNKLSAGTDGWLEYTVDQVGNNNKMIGLLDENTHSSGNNQYQDIDYNFYLYGNFLYRYSGGSFVTVNVGDIVRMERKGNKMYYKKNGIAFDSTLNCLTGELFVKASIGQHNGKFKNVRCSFYNANLLKGKKINWVLPTVSTLTVNTDGTNITKSGASMGWDNGTAYSADTLALEDSIWVAFDVKDTSSQLLMGFGAVDNSNADKANYKVFIAYGQLYIIETDNDGFYNKQLVSAVQPNDRIKVAIFPEEIRYYKNNVIIYRSNLQSDVNFAYETDIYSTGNGVSNIRGSKGN